MHQGTYIHPLVQLHLFRLWFTRHKMHQSTDARCGCSHGVLVTLHEPQLALPTRAETFQQICMLMLQEGLLCAPVACVLQAAISGCAPVAYPQPHPTTPSSPSSRL